MKNENMEHILLLLTESKKWEPIFTEFDPDDFFDVLVQRSNKFIHELHRVLSYRYSDNIYMNGVVSYRYYNSEIKFWRDFASLLEGHHSTDLKGLILRNLKSTLVDQIIAEMDNI